MANSQVMRNGQNKRMRGRNHRKNHNPLTRIYESNGPDVKIRGTASHVAEKYLQLARDAMASGDPIIAENYHQHAEHYFRLIAAAQEQMRQQNPYQNPYYRPESEMRDDAREEAADASAEEAEQPQEQPSFGLQPSYPPREAQPFPPREPAPREPQPFGGREQQEGRPLQQQRRQLHQYQPPAQPQPQPGQQSDGPDGERLPAFITGNSPQPSYGQNGYENRGERFPLHRRHRRHRGARTEASGSPQAAGGVESGMLPDND